MIFHSLTFGRSRGSVENRGRSPRFSTFPRDLAMLMNDKIMFDRYYCINLAKHRENEENIGALYFITSSHFPTRVRF